MKPLLCFSLLSLSIPLLCADSARPNLTGTWEIDAAKSHINSKDHPDTLTIQQDESQIRIDAKDQSGTETMKCETNGRECKTEADGHAAKVSFYFNGPLLIETDEMGRNSDRVVKKRIKLDETGKTMKVEVMHIVPQESTETWVFTKK